MTSSTCFMYSRKWGKKLYTIVVVLLEMMYIIEHDCVSPPKPTYRVIISSFAFFKVHLHGKIVPSSSLQTLDMHTFQDCL